MDGQPTTMRTTALGCRLTERVEGFDPFPSVYAPPISTKANSTPATAAATVKPAAIFTGRAHDVGSCHRRSADRIRRDVGVSSVALPLSNDPLSTSRNKDWPVLLSVFLQLPPTLMPTSDRDVRWIKKLYTIGSAWRSTI